MRAVKYLHSRFKFALNGNGTIKINQNDLDALSQISDFYETNYKNTDLEDALLLFYILQHWKVANINNEKIMLQERGEKLGAMAIPHAYAILDKLSTLMYPKQMIIREITDELRAHQAINKVPREQAITSQIVAELLENEIQNAKLKLPMLKTLNKGGIVKIKYSGIKNK